MSKRTCSIDGCGKPHFCRGWCTAHYSRWQRHGDPLIVTRTPPLAPDATEKRCSRCRQTKPLSAFSPRAADRNTLRGYCDACMAAYDAAYRLTETGSVNKRRAGLKHSSGPVRHDQGLQKRYGITLGDYEAMLEQQGGRCAICGTDQPTKHDKRVKRWTVDHCHITGAVRGLLCNVCNLGIGKFDDDPHLLRIAVAYLEATSAHRPAP